MTGDTASSTPPPPREESTVSEHPSAAAPPEPPRDDPVADAPALSTSSPDNPGEPSESPHASELGQAIDEVLSGEPDTEKHLLVIWQSVLDAWDDPKRHDAFLQACVTAENLGFAAARYREQREDELRGELARKKLTAVSMLAIQLLESKRTPPKPKTGPMWLQLVALLLFLAAMWWVAHAFSMR